MPDLARNVRTDDIWSATEFNVREDVQDDDVFSCIGCTAEMRPVAVTPGEVYWVVPHFRVRGQHDADCDVTQVAAAPVEGLGGQALGNHPALTPTRLRLTEEHAQDGLQARPQDLYAVLRHAAGEHGGEAGPGRHDHVARTLYRIAQCFLNLLDAQNPPLTLPGCAQGTYRDRFERLKAAAPRAYGRKVYYDAISFQNYAVDDAMMEIDVLLGPSAYRDDVNGKSRVVERFRVRFHMYAWSDRRRIGFLGDLRRAKERQMAMRDEDVVERILFFFLGTQDPVDTTLFHVDDGRLACFLAGPA